MSRNAIESKWTRRLVTFILFVGGVVAIFIVFAYFFGTQAACALHARRWARQIPIMNTVPVDLADLAVSAAPGEKVSFGGVELEIPWKDIDETKARIAGKCVSIYFQSGRSIILCVGAPDAFINSLSKEQALYPSVFAKLYGPQVLHSDYALFDALYQTTPSQITLATPSNRAAGLTAVLMVKAVMPPTTDWAIFRVKSKAVKGFQLGNPVRAPKRICLQLFADDAEFEVNIFQDGKSPDLNITQSEINRIIQTTNKATDTQPTLRVSPA